MVLGFLLSSTGVLCAAKTATIVGVGLPLVALGIPIFDTLFAMVRRVLEGRSLFSADRNHIHHRLLALGFSQTPIVLLLCAETAVAVCLVLFIPSTSNIVLIGIVAAGLLSHVTLFRVFGAVRFRDSFNGFSRIAVAARHAKEERMNLDDIELQFREATTINDWWQAVCQAGTELGFARMELDMPCRQGPPIRLAWSGTANPGPTRDDLVQMTVPVRHRRSRRPLSILVEAQVGDSLEIAGRHVAHMCRLLDRHSIADLPPGVPQRAISARKLQAV
jgi:UDP-GlcNAc:undecaprenyl-phosphate GlcNAc-1-phosphate transferase